MPVNLTVPIYPNGTPAYIDWTSLKGNMIHWETLNTMGPEYANLSNLEKLPITWPSEANLRVANSVLTPLMIQESPIPEGQTPSSIVTHYKSQDSLTAAMRLADIKLTQMSQYGRTLHVITDVRKDSIASQHGLAEGYVLVNVFFNISLNTGAIRI